MSKLVTITRDSYGGKLRKGDSFLIQGSTAEIFGIPDVWMTARSWSIKPISNYLCEILHPDSGKVYYGVHSGVAYCIHQSWFSDNIQT